MSDRRPLTPAELDEALDQKLEGWSIVDGKLHKTFQFPNFAQALGWMVSVGVYAEKMKHHPEWSNVYGRVTVNLVTHDMDNQISTWDIKLARRMDKLSQ